MEEKTTATTSPIKKNTDLSAESGGESESRELNSGLGGDGHLDVDLGAEEREEWNDGHLDVDGGAEERGKWNDGHLDAEGGAG